MKRITIKDIASETGLSIATVSYALNDKDSIPEETKKSVLDAASRLGYVPNYSARSLVMNTSNLIGVVIPQTEPGRTMVFENPFYSEILSSIEYHARIAGYHIIVSGTDADDNYLKLARQRNLDGIIIIGVYSKDFYQGLRDCNIPIVLVDTYIDDHHFHSIRINDRYGGYVATRYLLERGHRKIAFMSGSISEEGVNQKRYEGYCDALKEYGVALNKSYILADTIDFESGMRLGKRMMDSLDVTSVFCTADIMAIGILKQLAEMGVRVPDAISVIGFDNLSIARHCVPGLTTVQQDVYEKGRLAVELIQRGIKEPQSGKQEIVQPTQVVERESVRSI